MTTELTVRERVEQEVIRQFQLLAEREEARKVLGYASTKRNAVLNSGSVGAAEEEASTKRDAAHTDARAKYQIKVDRASTPLHRAQTRFDSLEQAAKETCDLLIQEADEARQVTMDAAQQEYDLTMAAAEAEVYRFKNEVASIQATIQQHRDVVKQSLGIDLDSLTQVID